MSNNTKAVPPAPTKAIVSVSWEALGRLRNSCGISWIPYQRELVVMRPSGTGLPSPTALLLFSGLNIRHNEGAAGFFCLEANLVADL